VSAKEIFGSDMLIKALLKYVPVAPAFFDKETLTDRNERFFVSEIIREKIFLQYDKEIPYSTEVSVEEFKEKKDITAIRAYIYAERESQKAILLGKNGTAIKRLGIEARKKIEEMLQKKVYLELTIKIRDGWRDDENMLNNFGYKE
jgi:GTP-binding protein Era